MVAFEKINEGIILNGLGVNIELTYGETVTDHIHILNIIYPTLDTELENKFKQMKEILDA